jgi:hypothetical protein
VNGKQSAYDPRDKEKHRWYKTAAWRLIRKSATNQMVVGATLFFTAVAAAILYMQWTTLNQTLNETRSDFKAAQRASVSLGGRDGLIGGLMNQTVKGKPVIALNFYNGGQSTARHFRVHVTTMHGLNKSNFSHIHRYRVSDGEIISTGLTSYGLAAQSEHIEYVVDPDLLWTWSELNNLAGEFAVGGDIEYCDEFGTYHCQGWGAEYNPLLGTFTPNSVLDLPCFREEGQASGMESWRRANDPNTTVKEIEPCEQPDEPEYYHKVDVGASITASGNIGASITIVTPKPTPTAAPSPTK